MLFFSGLGAWLLLTDYPTVLATLTFSEQPEPVSVTTASKDVNLSNENSKDANSPDEDNIEEASVLAVEDAVSEDGEEMYSETAMDEPDNQEDMVEADPGSSPSPSPPASQPITTQHTTPHTYGMQMPFQQNYAGYPWMASMFNPFYWMQMMMNPMVDAMTHPQSMDAMMRAMDPRLMFAVPNGSYDKDQVPDQLPVAKIPGFPTQSYQNWPKNTVSESISREAKMNAFQTAMAMSPLSMRNMISMMADKIPVAEDISWDDAVEAMKLRANEVNFKFVGSSALWKEIEAVTEQPSAKVEIFRFCDAAIARKILDEVPEFIVFLPCKIALIEDADGKLWVMTLDWDVSWMDFAQNPNNHLSKDLRADAKRIRESIQYIMEGAATGEF